MAIHRSHGSACQPRAITAVLAILAISVLPAVISAAGRAAISSSEVNYDDRHYLVTAGCSGSTASSFGIKLRCTRQTVSFFDAGKKSSGRMKLDKFVALLKTASGRPYGLMVGKAKSEADVEQGFRLFNVTYDSTAKTLDLDIVHVAGIWPGSKGISLKPVTLRRLDLYFHPLKFAKFLPAAKPENPFNQTVLLGPGGGSGSGNKSATANKSSSGAAAAATGRKLQQHAGADLQKRAGRKLQHHHTPSGRKLQAGADIWVTSPLTVFHAHVHKAGKVSIKCASTAVDAKPKCTITVELDKGLQESTLMASDKPIWAKHGVEKYVLKFRQSYSTNKDVVGLGKIIPQGAGIPPQQAYLFGFSLLDMTHTAGTSTAVVVYTIELHVTSTSGTLPTWIADFEQPATASLFMFQSNPKTKVQVSSQAASSVTPAFDAGTDCATIAELSSVACTANYLGTGFNVLSAFPYPGVSQPPGGDSQNGASLDPTSTPQSDYMYNNPIFTYDSLAANKREGATSCSGTMDVETSQSTSDSRTSLAVSASVSVDYWGVMGTASANYQASTETMSSGSYSMTTATLACQMASYNLAIDMSLFNLSSSFIQHVQTVVEDGYSVDSLYSLYRAFGSHWVDSVVLGGATTATIISTSMSISQQDNEDISVSATIQNSFAKASGDVSYNSESNYTADDLRWSWRREQSPSGAGITYGSNGAPDMTDYFNSLNGDTAGAYKWIPLSYTVTDIVSTIFNVANYNALWANSGLTKNQIVTLGTRYYVFVKQCAPGVTTSPLTCDLETDSSTCGSFSYSVYGEPLNNVTKSPSCSSCLEGINRNFSTVAKGACPWYSSGCPAATPSTTGSPPYTCTPPDNMIWTYGAATTPANFSDYGGVTGVYSNCLYVAEYGLDAMACLSSPSGQYRLCLNGRGQVKLEDTAASSGVVGLGYITADLNRAIGGYWYCITSGGNSMVYNPFIGVIWQSFTGDVGSAGNSCVGAGGPYSLSMQDDGNAVIYDVSGKALWATDTENGEPITTGLAGTKKCINCKANTCP